MRISGNEVNGKCRMGNLPIFIQLCAISARDGQIAHPTDSGAVPRDQRARSLDQPRPRQAPQASMGFYQGSGLSRARFGSVVASTIASDQKVQVLATRRRISSRLSQIAGKCPCNPSVHPSEMQRDPQARDAQTKATSSPCSQRFPAIPRQSSAGRIPPPSAAPTRRIC